MDAEPIDSDDSGATPVANHSPKDNSTSRLSHHGSESQESMHHHVDEDSRTSMQSGNTPGGGSTPNTLPTFQVSLNLNANAKKKKIVSDVFQNDDDQEDMNGPKKRKLVPLGSLTENNIFKIFID